MSVYEITTEGGVYRVETEDPVPAQQPQSFSDYAIGALKGVGKGAMDLVTAPADLLYRGGNRLLDAITGTQTNIEGGYPSDRVAQGFEYLSGGQGNETAETVGRLGANLGGALMVPSQGAKIAAQLPARVPGPLARMLGFGAEGAGYSVLGNAKEENPFEDVAIGAALGGGLQGVAEGVRGFANVAKDAGRKLELSAFGAGKARINKALDRMPEVLDDTGMFTNPISSALSSFRAEGGGAGGMEGASLMKELLKQEDQYLGKLATELAEAQALQRQGSVILPEFSKTKNYVEGLAGADKARAAKIADEVTADTFYNTDGTIQSIQNEKIKLSQAIRDSAWGKDAEGQLRTNILKRVRADLRETVEKSYENLTGKSGEVIKDLNQKIGEREGLYPLFKDIISGDEARNPLGWLMQNWRTSGGFGAMGGLSAILGAGAAPSISIPLVGGLAATPSGRRVIADSMRSGLVQGTPGFLQGAAGFAARATGAPAFDSNQSTTNDQLTGHIPSQEKSLSRWDSFLISPSVESANAIDGQLPPSSRSMSAEFDRADKLSQATEGLANRLSSAGTYRTPSVTQQKSGNFIDRSLDRAEARLMGTDETPKVPKITNVRRVSMDYVEPVVAAVIQQESSGNPSAMSDKGALGLMQVMPATAKEIAKELGVDKYDLKDPNTNIAFGTYYLKKMLSEFDGDLELALTAYHSGIGRVKNLLKIHDATTLKEIRPYLGPVGRRYATDVITKLKKIGLVEV